MQIEALLLAGRMEDAADAIGTAQPGRGMGALRGMLIGIPRGLIAVQQGRPRDARTDLEDAARSARAVRSAPGEAAARALLAEVAARTGDGDAEALLDGVDELTTGGIAGALVLRARAVLGVPGAAAALRTAAADLHAPGLLVGL